MDNFLLTATGGAVRYRHIRVRWVTTTGPTCRSITSWQRSSIPAIPSTRLCPTPPSSTGCICLRAHRSDQSSRQPPNNLAWKRPTIFRADERRNLLALLLSGRQRLPVGLAGLEQPTDTGECAQHSGVVRHPGKPYRRSGFAAGSIHRACQRHRLRRASGQQCSEGRRTGAADHDSVADQHRMAGFGLHSELRRGRRHIRPSGPDSAHSTRTIRCP